MHIKLDKDYEVKTTLGTIRDIEKTFGKSFFEIVNSVATMKLEDQIKLLFAGVRKAHPDIKETAFIDLCEDHLGMGDLMEYLEQYFYALQYPGLSEEEVQAKLEKKLQRTQALQNAKKAKVG